MASSYFKYFLTPQSSQPVVFEEPLSKSELNPSFELNLSELDAPEEVVSVCIPSPVIRSIIGLVCDNTM